MLLFLIILAVLIFFTLWNVCLLFYRDRNITSLTEDESKCFSQRCRSIVYKNGKEKAILFIHGFPTAPNMYAYSCKHFSEKGYDVFAPLIPTFGSSIEDFKKTNFSQWFSYIDKYYTSLRFSYEKVFIIGVSMGGAMTLKLCERYSSSPLAPEAVAVLSAPVVYNSFIRDRIITDPSFYIARTVALFKPVIGGKIMDGNPDGKDGDEEWAGYRGIFLPQAISLIWNLKDIRRNLGKITVPLISIHDMGDKTVPFKNQGIILSEIRSENVESYSPMMDNYRHTHHSLLMYNSVKTKYTLYIERFFDKVDKNG